MPERVIKLKKELQTLLQSMPGVVAAWEGGSAATGYLDEYSDLDLGIAKEAIEAGSVLATLEEWFDTHYGIARKFRMPEPAWHGMSQGFYLLRGMPQFFYCDVCVVDSSNPRKFTEPDRHGNAVVWFDPKGVIGTGATPAEELESMQQRLLSIATETDFLTIIELQKALARNDWMGAHMNWITFVNRHLVVLLNLKHRPCKADFGIRYGSRDYPQHEVEVLVELLRVTSCKHITALLPRALDMYNRLKQELLPGSPPVDLA